MSKAEVNHLDVLSELVRDGDVGLTDQERASLRWAITSLAPPVDHEVAEKAAQLKREYRPSLDHEVLHAWAKDAVQVLSAVSAAPRHAGDSTSALLNAARVWWKGNRPAGWSLEAHLDNPAVNCRGEAERALAELVATGIKADQSSS